MLLIRSCTFPAKAEHLLSIGGSNAVVKQCYYQAYIKCDIQLSFSAFLLSTLYCALLCQAARAGTGGMLFNFTHALEAKCCYSEG